MYLKAISIGDAIPRADFDATVHSVFESAINLRLTSGGNLLTLVASSEGDLPQGIRVDAPEDFSFEIFSVDEPVTYRDSILRLASLTVDLRGARRWKCDLPALEVDTTTPAVSAAWNFVWDALNQRQKLSKAEIVAEEFLYNCRCEEPRSGDEAISSKLLTEQSHENRGLLRNVRSQRHPSTGQANVSRKAGESIRDLVNATRGYDLTNTSSINSLIGLGSGLTPSGDDLLVGYLAGLWCSVRNKSERMQAVSHLEKIIIALLPKTNNISRTYLYHAAHGQISSRLADLAEAICRGENSEHLNEIAEAAMRVGHTSGMDAVTGLLIGLAAWEGNRLADPAPVHPSKAFRSGSDK